ncbi:helix-turn-helix domain-containing protein [Streptomyces longwoodensis]|uniref:helix-turn-helix domain-containing protein n=1 Tax=Streptomyces longwoodensis TaxID=68231 RepID=UPI002E7FC7A5|nr:helix-turn-helix domain-containing protein [Streptomyces longwoodensis]WUC55710.1 helix-turn-helix domain-containing protein [Streptomyces longwoodensis]WUC62170.1 helix-turn-helix domain-containing protein [Streptomyces longwoodensis]
MQDEPTGRTASSALEELRGRLTDTLAQRRLNQTQLAARARLGRTTVSEALSPKKPAPSAETVAALARALHLPEQELLELQRTAVGRTGASTLEGPGRPIGQWDPHALEVHPAGFTQNGSAFSARRILPGYVPRDHDRILAEAVREAGSGHSRMLALVGESSTGKTRACWEAVQPLAELGWRLWHPFDPTRAKAALEDLHRVGPRTVVWLNEAHHYLGDLAAGEQIAAAVHHLLTSPQHRPILVLGTLWPEYAKQYTALPATGTADPHSRVRELLAGRTLRIPDTFDTHALAAAAALAKDGDRLLADALTRARADGRLTQDLAGGPALLERYRSGSPAARALLEAAMDARRLGVGLHLPQAFLTDAAADYLSDSDWNQLTDDWAEKAYAELAEQVHGKQAPLSRITPRPQRHPPGSSAPADIPSPRSPGPVFRLADYLEQHGRTARRHLCPPATFWHAAYTHLTAPGDLYNLAEGAQSRHRLQWAHHLRLRAADHGSTDALAILVRIRERDGELESAANLALQAAELGDPDPLVALAQLREAAGDREDAENLYRQAVDAGDAHALVCLAQMREEAGDPQGAEDLARQAADKGDTHALTALAQVREAAEDLEGSNNLYQQAAAYGDTWALTVLAGRKDRDGDRESAESLARQAAEHGSTEALDALARTREREGDREAAEMLARQAADHGSTHVLDDLIRMRDAQGDQEAAEYLARQAAELGSTDAMGTLARMREEEGDQEAAEYLARQAADHGNTNVLGTLAHMRELAGDRKGAETLVRQAADHGSTHALDALAEMRESAWDRKGAEIIARQAAGYGSTSALAALAQWREVSGDREGAEILAREAADYGSTDALGTLARLRQDEGDREGAENLYREAADHGSTDALHALARMREEEGDRQEAENLYREAADHGIGILLSVPFTRLWPYGLDPDGTPTPQWRRQ